MALEHSASRSGEPFEPSIEALDAAALARATGFSLDAVETMRQALAVSGGRMAQFDHPEFGGFGQWMQGGMVMTSAGRDPVLEERIDRLCEALDGAVVPRPRAEPAFVEPQRASAESSVRVDPFAALDKLADLHDRGVVSDSEFAQKKTELLGRI